MTPARRATEGRGLLAPLFAIALGVALAWAIGIGDPSDVEAGEDGTGPGASSPGEDGWADVLIGDPSGADPIEVPRRELPMQTHDGAEPDEQAGELPSDGSKRPLSDFELIVQPGQVLSRIVQDHYGTIRGGLVDKVASYNQLENANALKVGATLYLPPIEKLPE